MLETQTFSLTKNNNKIGDRIIYYQKVRKNIMLTIFEGGHDMLSKQVVEYIEQITGIR